MIFFVHLRAEQIDHPVLITECVCNPVQSRSKMAELLFETYGVPSVGKNPWLSTVRKLSLSFRGGSFLFCSSCTCAALLIILYFSPSSQHLVLMLHSAISIINSMGFVIKMGLLFARGLPQLMLFQYAFLTLVSAYFKYRNYISKLGDCFLFVFVRKCK